MRFDVTKGPTAWQGENVQAVLKWQAKSARHPKGFRAFVFVSARPFLGLGSAFNWAPGCGCSNDAPRETPLSLERFRFGCAKSAPE